MNVQSQTFFKRRLFSVFDPRCLFRVSKTTRGAIFSKHALYYLDYVSFSFVSYPGEDSFALFSVDWSLYACFCVQDGQTCLYSDF